MTVKVFNLTVSGDPLFGWRLPKEVAGYSQARLKAVQWINVIKGFSQKGVKAAEIEDADVIAWLEEKGDSVVTKEDIHEFVSFSLPSIKECRLSKANANYKSYSFAKFAIEGNYAESLFYFPTVTEDLQDRIADLDEAITVLNFDFDKLAKNPDIVFKLSSRRDRLLDEMNKSGEGNAGSTHFSEKLTDVCPDSRADFAHMRWSIMRNAEGKRVLFLHELQSDWAQRGRADDWRGVYKKAPLVRETEHWTSFLLRRAIAIAVEENCDELTWIDGASMANGGRVRGGAGLDEFYRKIVPSCAKKIAKQYGSEPYLAGADFLKEESKNLAFLKISDAMKIAFSRKIPVYSYANCVENATFDADRAAVLARTLQIRANKSLPAQFALKVGVVREVLNAYWNEKPTASLLGKVIEVAFNADDPVAALDHEVFHFAYRFDLKLTERAAVTTAFAPGSPLLAKIVSLLLSKKEYLAAEQATRDPEEAAAHAYAYWRKGQFSERDFQNFAQGGFGKHIARIFAVVFPQAEQLLRSAVAWIRKESISPNDFVAKIIKHATNSPPLKPLKSVDRETQEPASELKI